VWQGEEMGKKKEMVGPTFGGGQWRASRNRGWEEEFGRASKMEGHLEVLLELCFFTKPLKFEVEDHTKASTGVCSKSSFVAKSQRAPFEDFGQHRSATATAPSHGMFG
jgi:hypothetical protein